MDIESLRSHEKAYAEEKLNQFKELSLDDKKKAYSEILRASNKDTDINVVLIAEYKNILSSAIDLTDTTSDSIVNTTKSKPKTTNINKVARMVDDFANICIIAGIVAGIWLGGYYIDYGTYSISAEWKMFSNLVVTITWIIAGVISFILLKALSEIIQILHDIRNNTSND